jgi:hypothetical protein
MARALLIETVFELEGQEQNLDCKEGNKIEAEETT